eukprot:6214065-Pleurochrysis_carterae.AAC.1
MPPTLAPTFNIVRFVLAAPMPLASAGRGAATAAVRAIEPLAQGVDALPRHRGALAREDGRACTTLWTVRHFWGTTII